MWYGVLHRIYIITIKELNRDRSSNSLPMYVIILTPIESSPEKCKYYYSILHPRHILLSPSSFSNIILIANILLYGNIVKLLTSVYCALYNAAILLLAITSVIRPYRSCTDSLQCDHVVYQWNRFIASA